MDSLPSLPSLTCPRLVVVLSQRVLVSGSQQNPSVRSQGPADHRALLESPYLGLGHRPGTLSNDQPVTGSAGELDPITAGAQPLGSCLSPCLVLTVSCLLTPPGSNHISRQEGSSLAPGGFLLFAYSRSLQHFIYIGTGSHGNQERV